MVYSRYDISDLGLGKSTHTGDGPPISLGSNTQTLNTQEGLRMTNPNLKTGTNDSSIFEQAFLGEIANTISIMESLYDATARIDVNLANNLLEKALIDLRAAVRKIASELTLSMHKSLESGVISPIKTRKSKPKPIIVQKEPEIGLEPDPEEVELPDINTPVRRNIFNNPSKEADLSFGNNLLYKEQMSISKSKNPNPNAQSGPVKTEGF